MSLLIVSGPEDLPACRFEHMVLQVGCKGLLGSQKSQMPPLSYLRYSSGQSVLSDTWRSPSGLFVIALLCSPVFSDW